MTLSSNEVQALKQATYFEIDRWGSSPDDLCPVAMVAKARGETFCMVGDAVVPEGETHMGNLLEEVAGHYGFASGEDYLDAMEELGELLGL